MFNFFKSKSKVEMLEEKYKKLTAEAYKLSHTNRAQSDQKQAEAEEVRKQIDALSP